MHSSFASLRGECPMDLSLKDEITVSEATHNDLRRLVELWGGLLSRFGGEFLVGGWSIADACFTPVATRLRSYGLRLSDYGDQGPCGAYAERLLQTPEFLEWEKGALGRRVITASASDLPGSARAEGPKQSHQGFRSEFHSRPR